MPLRGGVGGAVGAGSAGELLASCGALWLSMVSPEWLLGSSVSSSTVLATGSGPGGAVPGWMLHSGGATSPGGPPRAAAPSWLGGGLLLPSSSTGAVAALRRSQPLRGRSAKNASTPSTTTAKGQVGRHVGYSQWHG